MTDKREQNDWIAKKNLDGINYPPYFLAVQSSISRFAVVLADRLYFDRIAEKYLDGYIAWNWRIFSFYRLCVRVAMAAMQSSCREQTTNKLQTFHPKVKKLHTRPNFCWPSSRIALVYESFCSRTIADQLLYDWITENFGWVVNPFRNI